MKKVFATYVSSSLFNNHLWYNSYETETVVTARDKMEISSLDLKKLGLVNEGQHGRGAI